MRNLLVGSLLLLGACGSAAPSPAETYTQAAVEVAGALCGALDHCCTADERASFASALGSGGAGTCETAFAAEAESLADEIRAGAVALDPAGLAACLAEARRPGCHGLDALQTACAHVTVGQLAAGETCTDDRVCASGWCRVSEPGTRQCAAVPALGEPCSERCASGASCLAADTGERCAPALADGASCATADECASGQCQGADPEANQGGTCGRAAPICLGS